MSSTRPPSSWATVRTTTPVLRAAPTRTRQAPACRRPVPPPPRSSSVARSCSWSEVRHSSSPAAARSLPDAPYVTTVRRAPASSAGALRRYCRGSEDVRRTRRRGAALLAACVWGALLGGCGTAEPPPGGATAPTTGAVEAWDVDDYATELVDLTNAARAERGLRPLDE